MSEQNHEQLTGRRMLAETIFRTAERDTGSASIDFAPLGIATRIIADDALLLDAAIARFAGVFREIGAANPQVTVRLHWNQNAANKVGFSVAVEGSSLRLQGNAVSGWADALTGEASCELAFGCREIPDVAETLLLFLLTRSGRAPVHAATIIIGDTAVMLAGQSGSGKSSLALAAQRHGLEVLSEDTTYVQLVPLTVWGWPVAIHLHEKDAPDGDFPKRIRGGRLKFAVPIERGRSRAKCIVPIAIERGDQLSLDTADSTWLKARLEPVEPGFDLLREPIEKVVGAMCANGGWRMTLSRSPDDAITLLRERFA